ncbi:hypothetical protein PV04_09029 [Phialophora macrospora]|uniref:Beta-mannosidase B n=1 Tax=Phialophora macrospora TaxID=1851006 RepID=A0A0D2CG07_9EURO|nr:hypothetical protein PV04_09029 [Phialophora macrospora]
MSKQTHTLSSGWQWRLADLNGQKPPKTSDDLAQWHASAHMPSVVQMELLDSGVIPDPYIDENERDVQWVGEADWEYQCQFETPPGTTSMENVQLFIEGLDTFATVFLNEQEILQSANMFHQHRVDVSKIIKSEGSSNTLRIYFESPLKKSTALQKQYGVRKALERDPRRMHIRKAQYQWGWDFGPQIMTSGPWLPVHLEAFGSRIADPLITSKIAADHSSATVEISVGTEGQTPRTSVQVEIKDESGATVASQSTPKTEEVASLSLEVKDPALWWPAGHGKPTLYTAEITLSDGAGQSLDKVTTKFGIRSIQLVQNKLREGQTFMFNVNGKNIFAQGGNWIPADTMLPRITRETSFGWVERMQYAHHNMIRVWGGGIYETEDFYDACDEKGILVWQDYALACGDYRLGADFLDSLKIEAEVQTKRIRNRASLALLCGGNEDFLFQDIFWNGTYDHDDLEGPFPEDQFPQREIYLKILPKIASELAPGITYWANSPWGGSKDSNDLTIGDVHQWEVWHLHQYPYQDFPRLGGRFVSEYGMFSFPIMRTLEYFATNPDERYPQSPVMDCHSKATGQESRGARYLAENFRVDTSDLSNYAYITHILQSEAVWYGLCHWRRRFVPGNEECAGVLIWQTNDLYPGSSWSYVDYFLRPKPAYYTIRRALAPIQVGIQRTPRSRFLSESAPVRVIPGATFEMFAHNATTHEVQCRLTLKAYDFKTHTPVSLPSDKTEQIVKLLPGQNTELGSLHDDEWTNDNMIILEACLYEEGEHGALMSRFVDWPEPFRYLRWPAKATKVTASITPYSAGAGAKSSSELVVGGAKDPEWENLVTLTANYPIKGAFVEPVYTGKEQVSDPEPLWDDNMVDLMPNSPVTLKVTGLKGRDVRVRYLYDWES